MRTNRGFATRSALIVVFAGAMGLAAMAAYVKFAPSRWHNSDRPSLEVAPPVRAPKQFTSDTPTKEGAETKQTQLLAPVVEGDNVTLAGTSETIPEGQEPAVYLANLSIKAVHIENAKATSVKIENRIARIDFSPEIQDGLGSAQESNFLKALQVSLGQLPDVDKFQITVAGQPIDSLGHFDVNDPLEVIRQSPAKP